VPEKTYQVSVEDVVDDLEEQLVEEEEGPAADLAWRGCIRRPARGAGQLNPGWSAISFQLIAYVLMTQEYTQVPASREVCGNVDKNRLAYAAKQSARPRGKGYYSP